MVAVYNLIGQEVRRLVDRNQAAGRYSINWNGVDMKGRTVPPGIYYYRMLLDRNAAMRKMVVLPKRL